PDTPESQEEALFGRVAVNLRSSFAALILGNHFHQSHECDPGAAIVGGVFSESQFSVQFDVVDCGETSVFIGDAAGSLIKLFSVLLSPPVAQVALRIVLAALIVKSMG